MTEPDRLAEITARFHAGEQLSQEDTGWLIADATIKRGLLARLQWAGTHCERDRELAACPVCGVLADSEVVGQRPHEPDCWLAAELHSSSRPSKEAT